MALSCRGGRLLTLVFALAACVGSVGAQEQADVDDLAFKLDEAAPAGKDDVLGKLGATMLPDAAIPVLNLLAEDDPEVLPNTKALALKFAMRLADARCLPILKRMLASEDEETRYRAVRVLPFCDTTEAYALLTKGMKDPSRRVRLAAIESFGDSSNAEHFALLEKLAADPDSGVAGAAQAARINLSWRLGRMKRVDFGKYLGQDEYTPIACVGVTAKGMFTMRRGGLRSHFLHVYTAPRDFTAETIEKELPRYLKTCRLLCFAPRDEAAKMLVTKPALREALKQFLRDGGTLYVAGKPGYEAAKFLEEIGVPSPMQPRGGRFSAVASREDPHPVTRWPIRIPSEVATDDSDLSWGAWRPSQTAPFRSSLDPSRAAMVVQENVLGAGRVIFSGMGLLWRSDRQRQADIMENILACAFGEPDRATHYFFLFRPGRTTPHTAWGKPWGGAKPKVLFIGHRYTKRDILELTERADFDYEYATLLTRRYGPYGRMCDTLEGASIADVKQKLAGDYDCIVLAARYRGNKGFLLKHWPILPEEVRRYILRRVRSGVGGPRHSSGQSGPLLHRRYAAVVPEPETTEPRDPPRKGPGASGRQGAGGYPEGPVQPGLSQPRSGHSARRP